MSHEIEYSTPPQKLGKADVSFSAKLDRKTLGALKISKGGLVWFPKNNSYGFKVGWKDLGNFMETAGVRGERR